MNPKCGGWAAVLLCVGCEAVPEAAFDASPTDDATGDSSSPGDATGDDGVAPPCNLTAPFGNPQPVAGINTAVQDEGFFLSADGLRATFARGGTGPTRVYTATREDTDGAFGGSTAIPLGEISGSDYSTRPRLTADGLELYFDSTRNGTQRIYVATRATTQGSFGNSAVVPLNSDASMGSLAPSGTLYFHSNVTGTGFTLYAAKRSSQGFQAAAALNIAGRQPIISADELTVYFTVDRSAIFMATRPALDQPFGTPTRLDALDSPKTESPEFVTADGCALYFTSDRDGGAGLGDTYVARRPSL